MLSIVALLAAACAPFGADDVETADSAPQDLTAPDVPAMEEPADADRGFPEAADDGDAIEGRPIADQAPTGQKVIRTAEVVLESQDTNETLTRVRGVATRAGGYAATSDLRSDADGIVRGTVTLRVPTDTLDEVVEQLEELGDVVPLSRIDERDVTVEHADLKARIDNLTAYEQELRALLSEVRETTTRPEDLLAIFERIRSIREEIDVLEGRMAALSDRIAFATVTVTLRPLDEEDPEVAAWSPGDTFQDALAATGRLLTGLGDALIWFVITGLPVLVAFLGLPGLLAYVVYRRVRRDDSGDVPPPATPAAAPPPAPST